MSKTKVVHYASVEQATESDNTEYATITCDPYDKLYENPVYSGSYKDVTCKRCKRIVDKFNKDGSK